MHYIVFDLEFNQDVSSFASMDEKVTQYPFEIIQIGALKVDLKFHTIATYNRYIKPSIYTQINPFITELTGITTEQLLLEESFPEVFHDFIKFIGNSDSVFCTWGMSDMKELFKSADYYKLGKVLLPVMFINLQTYTSAYLNLPQKKLIKLQHAVELLDIRKLYQFHNALHDAYYTAEIFKKIADPEILPKRYEPNYIIIRTRQRKKIVDFEKLLLQFEKMFAHELSKEEQDMIILAYKMGKTNQFLKD